MPIAFALAPANAGEREFAKAMLDRRPLVPGQVLVADMGFAGPELEAFVAGMGAALVRRDRKNELFGTLGGMREWVERIIGTLNSQLDLEGHGRRALAGVFTLVAQRLCGMAAAIWFNWQIRQPDQHLTAYDH